MNFDYLELSLNQVLIAFTMIVLAVLLARFNRSRLERQYLLGAIRAFIQLWIMGYFLLWLFQSQKPLFHLLTLEFMILVGTYTAGRRQDSFTRHTFFALCIALHLAVLVLGGFLYAAVLQIQPLNQPHLFIPLMGMLIGNCANGAALSIHRLKGEVDSHRGHIEAALSLGASPSQALSPYVGTTLRNALIPSINSMMMMGIVQMPGIMTGQLISGIYPEKAVRYQIVVVYMLAGAVALTCHLTVWLESKRFFTPQWSLNQY